MQRGGAKWGGEVLWVHEFVASKAAGLRESRVSSWVHEFFVVKSRTSFQGRGLLALLALELREYLRLGLRIFCFQNQFSGARTTCAARAKVREFLGLGSRIFWIEHHRRFSGCVIFFGLNNPLARGRAAWCICPFFRLGVRTLAPGVCTFGICVP